MADPPLLPIEPKRVPSGGLTSSLTGKGGSLDLRIHAPHPTARAATTRHTPAATAQGHWLIRIGLAASCGGIRKSSTTSRIDWYRSSGSLARHRLTSRSSAGGVNGFTSIGRGSADRIAPTRLE